MVLFFACTVVLYLGIQRASAHELQSYVSRMNENEFAPDTLEIRQGDTVAFQNDGVQPHWPASNIHPSHQIYPEFDSMQGIKPGEQWSFQFQKDGTWKLHDHLNPQLLGEITVKADSDFTPSEQKAGLGVRIKKIFSSLQVQAQKLYFRIFPKALEKKLASASMRAAAKNDGTLHRWIQLAGPEKIMKKILAESGDELINDCHYEAHQVGRISFEIFGASILERRDTSCASGFYHGIIEEIVREAGAENVAEYSAKICGDFKTNYSTRECFHGIGHALIAYESFELPKALLDCQKIKNDLGRSSCYDGVFMENYLAAQEPNPENGHVTRWASNDPHFPCNALSPDIQLLTSCYLSQTSLMLAIYDGDFKKVAGECMRAQGSLASTCFLGLGRDIADISLGDPEKMRALCSFAPRTNNYHDACIIGAVGALADFWGEELRDQSVALCRVLPVDDKENCYTHVAARLRDTLTVHESRLAACAQFEPNYQPLCIGL